MPRRPVIAIAGLAAAALTLAGCGGSSETGAAGDPVVAVTTTPLGSVVGEIAQCAAAESVTVMGPGDDPHEFSPSSQQVAQMSRAELIVTNGLGLEANMTKAIDSAQSEGAVVYEVAPNVDPLPFGGHDDHGHGDEPDDHPSESGAGEHAEDEHTDGDEHAEDEHTDGDEHAEDEHTDEPGTEGEHGDEHSTHDGHDHGSEDPHFWLDAERMSKAANLIGAKLTEVTGEARFTECGKQVADELTKVDEQVTETLSSIPADKRVIITDHDAYGYFADAYDFEVAGVVVPGGSTDAEPSSEELAALVKVIKERQISTVFSNTAVNSKLVEAVAAETGTEINVVPLHVGSVGPEGSGAETYAGMMTTNATLMADALK